MMKSETKSKHIWVAGERQSEKKDETGSERVSGMCVRKEVIEGDREVEREK